MNVYIMYKFSDYPRIKDSINILEEAPNLSVFYFSPDMKSNHRWKGRAKDKIKSADVICYFFNYESAKKSTVNLQWEYNFAVKQNKKIIIINNENRTDVINKLIASENKNSFFKNIFNYSYNEKELVSQPLTFEQGKEKLVEQSTWNIENKLLIEDESDIDKESRKSYYSLLMEQYKIMIDTSERLMDRRQATSNLYTTVCTALVALVGSSFALKNMFALSVIFCCVGIVSIILAVNWNHALESYSRNNEGKFAVLNEIEKRLPANMFDSEYRYNKLKGIKSFASREKMLPWIFKMLGFIFLVCGILFLILKLCNIDFFVAS